jgi:hypothetical protein
MFDFLGVNPKLPYLVDWWETLLEPAKELFNPCIYRGVIILPLIFPFLSPMLSFLFYIDPIEFLFESIELHIL